jgi:hypothetical protein
MKIGWFSAGITSAVACKLAVEEYNDVELFYIGIRSQHEDNERFIQECEQWIGKKIYSVSSEKYEDQFQVIRETKYINGPYGARCTLELKKEVRWQIQEWHQPEAQIFGFEYSKAEINRAIRFREQNPEVNAQFPLIDKKLTKGECAGILAGAGIDLPVMYKLGYNNNNCIGCVKGGMGYWNKIRKDFPEVFEEMAKLEREIGATCIKKNVKETDCEDNVVRRGEQVYLDELDPDAGDNIKEVVPECGIFCQVEFAHLMDAQVDKIVSGEIKINDV